jgi:hypothetical protein
VNDGIRALWNPDEASRAEGEKFGAAFAAAAME